MKLKPHFPLWLMTHVIISYAVRLYCAFIKKNRFTHNSQWNTNFQFTSNTILDHIAHNDDRSMLITCMCGWRSCYRWVLSAILFHNLSWPARVKLSQQRNFRILRWNFRRSPLQQISTISIIGSCIRYCWKITMEAVKV